ncbi:MAG: 50S ribosomal protein L25/general stress protein Ctc [Chromatiaceae bacterium]|jgi:large subunit ribosomal protein L25|nr:50S ribosomal protein L25/general stress protein Ctc [Candidatus Thioaporhodococcus sediminis]
MIEKFQVQAEPRSDAGKGASRRLRRTGQVPAIVYGAHQEPEMISLSHNEMIQHLEHEAFYSHLLTLKMGNKVQSVVLKALQRHPAKPFILHADFQRVQADEKLRMTVPIHFLNEANCKGVKLSGGVVSHSLNEIEISCLPKDLPEYIAIDLVDLELGDIIHLSEVPLPAGVELAQAPDPDVPVVVIHSGHGGGGEEEGKAS